MSTGRWKKCQASTSSLAGPGSAVFDDKDDDDKNDDEEDEDAARAALLDDDDDDDERFLASAASKAFMRCWHELRGRPCPE